jgi:type I restriction enzyme S subunit
LYEHLAFGRGDLKWEAVYWTDAASFKEWTKRGRPESGDILFTREAPMGEACIAPEHLAFCLGQRMMIYRPNLAKIDPRYLVRTVYSTIGRNYIEAKGKGSTVGHLRVSEVYDFPCLLPPVEEQRAILCELDRCIGPYSALRTATRASVDRLGEFRAAVITAAVTGQIDVATWGKRDTTDRRLDDIEAEMAAAAPPERAKARA